MRTNLSTSYLQFRAFQFMWVVFFLFHMAISSPGWTSVGDEFLNPSNNFFLIANLLVITFSLASLFRPKKIIFFILAILFLTIVKLDALPSVPNHIILMLIIHFTILFSFPFYWDKSRVSEERIGKWFDKVAPYLRIELLLLYFFVVLHKLNFDYFNPAVSCSVELYTDIARMYPVFPTGSWMNWTMIGTTLFFEMIIPVLLIIPATRIAGIFTGMVFHFMLSLHPNLYILSFTAEIYALYILFLPQSLVSQIFDELKQRSVQIKRTLLTIVGSIVLGGGGFLIYNQFTRDTFTFSLLKKDLISLFNAVPVLWFGWCIFLIIISFMMFRQKMVDPSRFRKPLFKLSRSLLIIFPVLTFLNGITPYIGLKTATNFSMFSNLRVEGASNNHLFMPSNLQVSDIQENTVTLTETNSPFLRNFINNNERITYFELTRYLYANQSADIYVTFKKDGRIETINLPEDKPPTWIESSWAARKLLSFRGIPESGPTPCQW